MTKRCPKCGIDKPDDQFHKNRAGKDGLADDCKDCNIARSRAWYASHRDEARAANHERYMKNRDREREKRHEYYLDHKGQAIERAQKWSNENPDRRREINRAWAAEHPDTLTRWRKSHPDSRRESHRKWSEKNPAKLREYKHKRRSLEVGNGGSFTAEEWEALCDLYVHRCLACGEKRPLTVDHVVPIAKGGRNDIANIQPLCLSCNDKKGIHHIDYRIEAT